MTFSSLLYSVLLFKTWANCRSFLACHASAEPSLADRAYFHPLAVVCGTCAWLWHDLDSSLHAGCAQAHHCHAGVHMVMFLPAMICLVHCCCLPHAMFSVCLSPGSLTCRPLMYCWCLPWAMFLSLQSSTCSPPYPQLRPVHCWRDAIFPSACSL